MPVEHTTVWHTTYFPVVTIPIWYVLEGVAPFLWQNVISVIITILLRWKFRTSARLVIFKIRLRQYVSMKCRFVLQWRHWTNVRHFCAFWHANYYEMLKTTNTIVTVEVLPRFHILIFGKHGKVSRNKIWSMFCMGIAASINVSIYNHLKEYFLFERKSQVYFLSTLVPMYVNHYF